MLDWPNILVTTVLTITIVLFLREIGAQNLEKSRSVWVEQGLLRGKIYKIGDKFMQIFRGIPYAEPPVGSLRFKKPVKRGRWHQEYAALDYGAPCLQFMEFHQHDKYSESNMENESENCLYLNVFSPYDPEDESRLFPVLVWIHGGSFLAGSGDTAIDMEVIAKNFIFNDVVLVTLNYRLGLLGFMNHRVGDKNEGNYGIWDMVAALEWIQANMKQLNGDPLKITVMGESAGAAATSLLAVSPRSKDLFQQAITLSGSSTAGWAIHRFGQSLWSVANIASYLRHEKTFDISAFEEVLRTSGQQTETKTPECLEESDELNEEELVECFRNDLNLTSFTFRHLIATELGVSKMVMDDDLIPMSGVELIEQYAHMPILIGVAHSEWAHKKAQYYGLNYFGVLTEMEIKKTLRKIIDDHFHTGCAKKLHNSTLDLITNATYLRYIDSPDNNRSLPRVVNGLQDLEADIEFVAPAQKEIDAYVENGLPVYAYSFDYFPRSPVFEEDHRVYSIFGRNSVKIVRKELQIPRDDKSRAFHGLDHAYIFTRGYSSNLQVEPFTKRDRQMSKMLATMITNFVKKGNPTPTDWNGFEWPMYTNESAEYAILDLPPRVSKGSLHWPATNYWNKEALLLERFSLKEKGLPALNEELTTEERLQLSAYRRAWWALWLLVAMIALVIWISVICIVVTRCRSPRAKPYNNIVVNR